MLFFVIVGMIGRARGRVVAHNTVFWRIFAIVTDQTIFHPAVYLMAIQVLPVGYTGVTQSTVVFFMFFMGKIEVGREAIAGSQCFAGLFEMAKAAVAFFACFEMTLEASRFAGAPKSIVDIMLVGKYAARIRGNYRSLSQWLPARRHRRRFRSRRFAVNMANRAINRIFLVGFVRKSQVCLGLIPCSPDEPGKRETPEQNNSLNFSHSKPPD